MKSNGIDELIQQKVQQAVHQAVQPILKELNSLREEIKTPSPSKGKLFTSRQAWIAISVKERQFRKLVAAGVIKPDNPDTINGEHHRFTRAELDRFLAMPSGEIRRMLAMYEAKKAREAQQKTKSRTGSSLQQKGPSHRPIE